MKLLVIASGIIILLAIFSISIPLKSESFSTCVFTDDIKKSRFSILRGEKTEYDNAQPILPETGKTCADMMGWEGSQSKQLHLL